MPSGVYEGKMWRRREPYQHEAGDVREATGRWYLMWFGASDNPDNCSINHRKIIIV